MILSAGQGSMCHVTNSTFINDRIAKGVVIGAHITSGETQRDITLADSRTNEKFCYEASDTAMSVTCLGTALMNGALYFAVSIGKCNQARPSFIISLPILLGDLLHCIT